MLFFHYNIAKAFFAINLKGTEYGRSEKYSMDMDFEAFIYCDKGICKIRSPSGRWKKPLLLGDVAAEGGRRGLKDAPLTRLRRELSQRESLFSFTYSLSIFLTSTAFVSTNAKYGIPLSRYAVF